MQIRVFTIPALAGTEMQEEMNKFLRGHRVMEVKQQYDSERGYWTFAVNYIEGSVPNTNVPTIRSEKVDYKTVLSPECFDIFTKLRDARKQIAKDESIPAYAIFTDKELSDIAQLSELTPTAMLKIEGINHGRVDRYAERILQGIMPNRETAEDNVF
jgi:superfamily II DNA helicase RecQ